MKYFLLLFLVILNGCAVTVTPRRIERPWFRIMNKENAISLNSNFFITVTGKTEPLLGRENLLHEQIKNDLTKLMLRRGFKVNEIKNAQTDYHMFFDYKITRHDKLEVEKHSELTNYSAFGASNSYISSYGHGVYLANQLNLATSKTVVTKSESFNTITYYTTSIEIEIIDNNGNQIWKAQTIWENNNIDIQTNLISMIQILLSDLPRNEYNIIKVPKLKTNKVYDFYRNYCREYWFTCPALPSRIYFPYYTDFIFEYLKNPEALTAYLDLVQTAEFALPIGDKNYHNPLNKSLWTKVMLGNKYKLGNDEQEVFVLIKLVGTEESYFISKCWIADKEEEIEFNVKMIAWKKALKDYFDFYEK